MRWYLWFCGGLAVLCLAAAVVLFTAREWFTGSVYVAAALSNAAFVAKERLS